MTVINIQVTQAASSIIVETEIEAWEYYDSITVSAYYPGEAGCNVNHRDVALSDLADTIVATQSSGGHSNLIGKTIKLVLPDGTELIRKVDDTGCMHGRLDLLVSDYDAMNAWGLKECEVWIYAE